MANKKKTPKSKIVLVSLIALIIGFVIGYFGGSIFATNDLIFNLNGKNTINIGVGNEYIEKGVICNFKGIDYTDEVVVTYYDKEKNVVTNIDTSIVTTYFAEYKIDTTKIVSKIVRVINIVEFEDLEINFMMLGNEYAGDSIYIKAGDTDILVDAGSRKNSAPYIKDYLLDASSELHSYVEDNKLEYVIVTHADQDHIAAFLGPNGIFNDKNLEIETIIEFAKTTKDGKDLYEEYRSAVNSLEEKGTKRYTALDCYNNVNGASRVIELAAGIELEILYNYYYEHEAPGDNENLYSVCFMLRRGEEQFLFTGDLENEGKGEEYLVQYNVLGKVYLYKMGHHGSKTSTSEALLSVINPEVAVATCVAFTTEYTSKMDNTFPTKMAIDNLVKYNVKHLYVPYMVSDNEAGFEEANGHIVVHANSNGTYVECSKTNEDFYNFEIFKEYRSWTN